MERKIFLEKLPKKQGIGSLKDDLVIDWLNSKGYIVNFVYDNIEGCIEIIDYTPKGQYLTIKYLNYDLFKIKTGGFTQCKLGKMLDDCNPNLQVKIGQCFKDNNRNLTIIGEEYKKNKKNNKIKSYSYHCNICNWDKGLITKWDLLRGNGCSCCRGLTVVKNINSIYTTNPELVEYFVNINDTYVNTIGSHNKVLCKCLDCGTEKEIAIYNLHR